MRLIEARGQLGVAAGRGNPWRVAVARSVVRTAALALFAALTLASAPVLACPKCAAGIQARSEVWTDRLGFNLFALLLPFLLIGAVCVYAEKMGGAAALGRGATRPRADPGLTPQSVRRRAP